ncbi:gamma-butyrobetaine dioxygenase-like [Diadema antillarum]|uniref:gamma-butyrobetaine dioxygenase-like n=1 Tax=Diadema antillarum TaxID=105358 RepID=UPI003A86DB4B
MEHMETTAYRSDANFFPTSEWKSGRRVKYVKTSPKTGLLLVEWDDDVIERTMTVQSPSEKRARTTLCGSSTSYPYIWLRDFCHCEECFDEKSETKRTNLQDLDINVAIEDASVDGNGSRVSIRWSDGHASIYPAAWLWCHQFLDTKVDPFIDMPQEIWNSDTIPTRLQKFNYDAIMTSDKVMCDWLMQVKVLGLALIENAPQRTGTLREIGRRVGYLKDCNFGLESSVYAPTDPSNPDYTAGNLYFHTDLTYYLQQPGIELLHCIKQFKGVGGDSTLVDGFNVATRLKAKDPEAFEALSTQEVEFYQNGLREHGKYFQLARNKIIRLNSLGELEQISYSNHSRTSVLRMPVEKVGKFYKAMKLFIDLLYDPENMFLYKMKPGDILVMNNFRVLHGRKGFTMEEGSERHLQTGYMDWDLVYSKLRVLRSRVDKLGMKGEF